MFDKLYKQPHAIARHQNGPLAEERRRYLVYCAEQQMSLETLEHIARKILIIARTLRLVERPGELITRTEIVSAAHRWVKERGRKVQNVCRECRRFIGHAVRWLSFLGRLQTPVAVRQPYADLVAQFIDYMIQERGLSQRTVAYNSQQVQAFLTEIDKANLQLRTLTGSQVNELLANKIRNRGYVRVTVKRIATAIRTFLRFAEQHKWCKPGLSDAIRTPRVYAHEGLPLGLSWDDVNRLIAATEGDESVEIRDRAILLLLAVYGLRSGEVTTLKLDDFNWEDELLTVSHGKNKRPRTYPLCHPVGEAVLRYLRVRPRSDRREIFITVLAPFRSLHGATVGGMVSRRLHALGLTLPHYGAHVLRHACARHLLAQGFSLKEIGDHLGHQSPQATRIYAKIDLAALRIVGEFELGGLL
ncbi:Tyrosine recombinase XerD [Gimesia alba]|uniref:Tyrosine recombinase XerD n=1 Tax=Gimesia alba TaxID=2527973 RepID=A0A517RMT1_9PLAN|nr:site-specific integrase [Gimesia alba]QDT45191.1 Tyrosine recombinase XerD [Gimesia alba]